MKVENEIDVLTFLNLIQFVAFKNHFVINYRIGTTAFVANFFPTDHFAIEKSQSKDFVCPAFWDGFTLGKCSMNK